MRVSSALFVFVFAAVSSNAAPILGINPDNLARMQAYFHRYGRADTAVSTSAQDSEALGISTLFKIGEGIVNAGKSLFSGG